jgi:hypothetical protein
MAADLLDEGARLITEVGACHSRARRYRAIAADCEERVLGRALALGGALRTWAREAAPDRAACAAAVAELRQLIAYCDAAVAAVHASVPYRAALTAWEGARWSAVAALTPAIFDGIDPLASARPLYFPISVVAPRGGTHFLPPPAVAERVCSVLRGGLPAADPVPELGADEALRAVVLDDDPDAVETPVTLVVEPEDVSWPLFRLVPAGEVFVYVPRLEVRARVRCTSHVADEWWAVRPDAYEAYVTELAGELSTRGIANLERG